MYANYHTHTFRCHHARGTEREYIEQALEAGMKILGFSDHVPYNFPNGHDSGFRMYSNDLEDYISTLAALRDEYKSDIEILTGFEAEYYPDLFEDMLDMIGRYEYDYLLLGQHFVGNEIGTPYSGFPTANETDLKNYVDQTIAAMKTGRFSCLTHPDTLNYTGSPDIYREHMTRLCISAKETGIPLEINFLGMSGHRHYPNDAFFRIAGKTGNQVIFGCDAHYPEALNDPETMAACEALVKRNNLDLIDRLVLR
ncbi:MAG: histidinol-phosphatase [Saccharofermentanales bacterium]